MLINNLKHNFNNFLRTNLYKVWIYGLPFSHEFGEEIFFLCKTASFPFPTFDTYVSKYNNLSNNIASSIDHDPITFTFSLDDSNKVYSFFKKWYDLILDQNNAIGYKSEYASSIFVEVMDLKGRRRMTAEMINAFPVNIEELPLTYEGVGSVLNLTVSFVYEKINHEVDNNLTSILYNLHLAERLLPYPETSSVQKSIQAPFREIGASKIGLKNIYDIENTAKNAFNFTKKSNKSNAIKTAKTAFKF